MNLIKNALLPFTVVFAMVTGTVYAADPLGTATAEELHVSSPVDAVPTAMALVDASIDPVVADHATPPKVDVPDPVKSPNAAWQFLVALYKLGIWPLIAAIVLMTSRFIVARMQPTGKSVSGWRLKTLAIAAGLVAVSGPLLELLLHTGGAAALATGVIYAAGLLKDAFDPPRGSAAKV